MNSIIAAIRAEPPLAMALVQELIALVSTFGLNLTAAQTAAILVVTQLLLALVTRQMVTPNSKVPTFPQFPLQEKPK